MSNKDEELQNRVFEQKSQIVALLKKIKSLEEGKPVFNKDLLGLIPGSLYLLITDGRRLVGKVVFENKGWVAYTKRAGTMYYANKTYIQLIKELDKKEQESYLKSNFDILDRIE